MVYGLKTIIVERHVAQQTVIGLCWFLSNKDLVHKVKYQVVILKWKCLSAPLLLLLQAFDVDNGPYVKYNK